MIIDVFQTLVGGVIASVIWFIVGGILYMNPVIAKVYKEAEDEPALKKWEQLPQYLGLMFVLGALIPCVAWAFIFAIIEPALFQDTLLKGLSFGAILILIKIIPRLNDMWIQTTYPNKLLTIEVLNGAIGSLLIGVIFALLI